MFSTFFKGIILKFRSLNFSIIFCITVPVFIKAGVAGIVLEYLSPNDGWLTTAAASSLRELRERPVALVRQVILWSSLWIHHDLKLPLAHFAENKYISNEGFALLNLIVCRWE